MNDKQIDYLFYIIHNRSGQGKITVNFHDHSGDHDVDLHSINWYELRNHLRKINLDDIPPGEYCEYEEPITKDLNWNI